MKLFRSALCLLSSALWLAAQPAPPATGPQAVMANAPTGQLATPANFFTNPTNAAAIGGAAPVQSVAGRTGVVTLTKTDVGLANVDNTSDANKPVSTAQAAADALALAKASNLSDLANAATARANLGLGTLATQSGTFSGTSSGTNTGDQTSVTGNAGTATALQTGRTINGVSFDGTTNVTVTAAAPTLTGTGLPVAAMSVKASDANAVHPITVYVKNATVLTTGTPADIATITVPAGITRYRLLPSGASSQGGGAVALAETASGTMLAASFTVRDTASGAGTALYGGISGPSSAGATNGAIPTSTALQTASTIYVNQTANSANAGTVSFYLTIWPLP